MRQNPHVRICGGPGSATTLVYPTAGETARFQPFHKRRPTRARLPIRELHAQHLAPALLVDPERNEPRLRLGSTSVGTTKTKESTHTAAGG